MKIFILVDMEGISGICRRSQVMPDGEHWQEGRRYMTEDTNTCVQACLEAGATEIIVRDVHNTAFNLIWHELAEGARYVLGNTQSERMPELESCDGLILLGYHAMAGTPQGILEHTASSSSWQNLWMNGEKVGEIAVDAGIAGDAGVPVIMVSGDDKTCAEAKACLGDVTVVEVKKGLDIEGGMLVPPIEARKRIREGTLEAVRRCRDFKPFQVNKPVTLRLELVSRGKVPTKQKHVTVIDGRTFEVTADTVQEAVWLLEG